MDEQTTASGRHPVNITHLVMGIVFLGIATIWALVESNAASASAPSSGDCGSEGRVTQSFSTRA